MKTTKQDNLLIYKAVSHRLEFLSDFLHRLDKSKYPKIYDKYLEEIDNLFDLELKILDDMKSL